MRLMPTWSAFALLLVGTVAGDTSFYADGSIDYENSDFDDYSPAAIAPPAAAHNAVADDRTDVVLESRKKEVQRDTDDVTNPEYFKEARANAEHIKNLGMGTRLRSNDKAEEPVNGLAAFLASHAVKDEASSKMDQDWYAPDQRTVPQIAAGIGEYELRNPIHPIQPSYQSQPPMMMPPPEPQMIMAQPPLILPPEPPQQYFYPDPYQQPPLDFRQIRPPNSNAVYARAMMVGMKPIGPPLEVNPQVPAMQSNFRPYGYDQGPGPQLVDYSNTYDPSYNPYGDKGMVFPRPYGRNDQEDEEDDEDDTPVDDSKLEDLPLPAEDKVTKNKASRGKGGNPGTNDYFYYNMFGGAANMQGDEACPPGQDCKGGGGDTKVVHLPSGKTLKVKSNSQGKIKVMIEGSEKSGSGPSPDPKKLEEHMQSAIANAATVKERIAATEAAEPWNLTTTVTVSLGVLLAGITGIMGFTLMQQRARSLEREDSTTIHSRSASKVELGQDLSDYCYREDVRRLAHILEDD